MCFVGEKLTFNFLTVFAFGTVLAFEEVLTRVYSIPRVITCRFNRETQQQLFLSLYGRHIGAPLRDTNVASPNKALFLELYSITKLYIHLSE